MSISMFDMCQPFQFKRATVQNSMTGDLETASYGHMGREPKKITKSFTSNDETKTIEVELFTWEKLDFVEKIKKHFKI